MGNIGVVGRYMQKMTCAIFVLSAEYISLLFTDLGVLTPAAVSDELIQLYV